MDNRASVERVLLVALGGAIGTVLRYLTSSHHGGCLALSFLGIAVGRLLVDVEG
jgi:fluoride ion exporter CrcB/FEX